MDKFKEILTKYWVGILCGVVALIAIIASFVPLGGYHEQLKQKLQSSAHTYTELNSLLTAHRLKPKMFGDTEQQELGVFPSQTIIDSGKTLVADLEKESRNAMATVVKINIHPPVAPGALPNPGGPGGYNFRDAYLKRLNPIDGTIYTQTLKATMPPTTDDIKKEGDRLWKDEYVPRLIPDASGSGSLNKDLIDKEYKEAMDRLPGEMRSARAQAAKVYMAPTVMVMDPTVSNRLLPPPSPVVMWWAQMALWVQEDVAAGVAEANKDAANVTQSRVKRIVAINFPIGPQMIYGKTVSLPGSSMPGAAPDATAAPTQNPNDQVPLDFTRTASGRISCGLYDVVRYQVELVVAAKELPAVLTSFSDNKLVTVMNIENLVAEDGAAASKDGYLYGPDPVVRVTLRCESLFLREWTAPLMPDLIKKMLGVPLPPPPTP
jgi:hypothetical protein